MSEWTSEPGRLAETSAPERDNTAANAGDAQQHAAQQDYMKQLSKDGGGQGGEQVDAGLANYEASLGKYLGSKLHKAVSKAITPEKAQSYAEKAVDRAIGALVDQIDALDTEDQVPDSIFEQLKGTIFQELQPEIEELMKSGAGRELVDSIGEWVDGHPRTVFTIVLLAAAGVVLSDAKVPKIKKKFNLGESTQLKLSAKLGTFMNIHLEEIKAQLEGAAGSVKYDAQVTAGQSEENGQSLAASLRVADKDDKWWLKAGAQQDHTGEAYELGGGFNGDRWYGEGNVRHHSEEGTSGLAKLGYRHNDRWTTEGKYSYDQMKGHAGEVTTRYKSKPSSRWSTEFGAGYSEKMGSTVRAGLKWSF